MTEDQRHRKSKYLMIKAILIDASFFAMICIGLLAMVGLILMAVESFYRAYLIYIQ